MIEVDDGGAAWMPSDAHGYRVNTAAVAFDFFEVFQAPFISGRGFDSRDAAEGVNTIVVNQSFVDHVLGGRSPIGRRVRYAVAPDEQPGPWYEIVGVVRNPVEYGTPSVLADADVRAQLYHPLSPSRPVRYPLYLAVHVRADPTTAAPALRRIAQDVGSSLRLDIQTIDQVASDDERFLIFLRNLVLLASAIALFLSLGGIYSVMSFTVSRRIREIGVRIALGAQASRVVTETFRRPLRLVAVGVTVGCVLVGAMMAFLVETFTNDWWEAAQYGLAGDAKTLMMAKGAALLLAFGIAMMGICALACIGPTRRALRVQPTEALREER